MFQLGTKIITIGKISQKYLKKTIGFETWEWNPFPGPNSTKLLLPVF